MGGKGGWASHANSTDCRQARGVAHLPKLAQFEKLPAQKPPKTDSAVLLASLSVFVFFAPEVFSHEWSPTHPTLHHAILAHTTSSASVKAGPLPLLGGQRSDKYTILYVTSTTSCNRLLSALVHANQNWIWWKMSGCTIMIDIGDSDHQWRPLDTIAQHLFHLKIHHCLVIFKCICVPWCGGHGASRGLKAAIPQLHRLSHPPPHSLVMRGGLHSHFPVGLRWRYKQVQEDGLDPPMWTGTEVALISLYMLCTMLQTMTDNQIQGRGRTYVISFKINGNTCSPTRTRNEPSKIKTLDI